MQNAIAWFGLAVLMVFLCGLIGQSIRGRVADWFGAGIFRIWLLPVAMLTYNFVLMKATGAFQRENFLNLTAYFVAPTLVLFLYSVVSSPNRLSSIAPFLAILMLWIPVELGWMFSGWKVGGGAYPFVTAAAMIYGLIALSVYSEHVISLTWRWRKEDWKYLGKMFWRLFAVVVPLGLVSGFIKLGINPEISGWHAFAWPLLFVVIWFAPALCEEMIFRAGIQNTLEKWYGWDVGWVAAAMIFGASHLNNHSPTRKVIPNWEYAFFATIAGLMYGWVYKKLKASGSQNALGFSAFIHASVDFSWVTFFHGVNA